MPWCVHLGWESAAPPTSFERIRFGHSCLLSALGSQVLEIIRNHKCRYEVKKDVLKLVLTAINHPKHEWTTIASWIIFCGVPLAQVMPCWADLTLRKAWIARVCFLLNHGETRGNNVMIKNKTGETSKSIYPLDNWRIDFKDSILYILYNLVTLMQYVGRSHHPPSLQAAAACCYVLDVATFQAHCQLA